MTISSFAFRAPPALPIASGATTPDPGGTSAYGTTCWSTTTNSLLYWSGSSWTAFSSGAGTGSSNSQVEVTFPFKTYGTTIITVAVPGVTVGQKVIASLSADAASTGFVDDIEFDNVVVSGRVTTDGYIDFACTPIPGPISGNRKINYTITS